MKNFKSQRKITPRPVFLWGSARTANSCTPLAGRLPSGTDNDTGQKTLEFWLRGPRRRKEIRTFCTR
jgi:hypothetical protein